MTFRQRALVKTAMVVGIIAIVFAISVAWPPFIVYFVFASTIGFFLFVIYMLFAMYEESKEWNKRK